MDERQTLGKRTPRVGVLALAGAAVGVGVFAGIALLGAAVRGARDDAPYATPPPSLAATDILGDELASQGLRFEEPGEPTPVGDVLTPGIYVAPDAAATCTWLVLGSVEGTGRENLLFGAHAGFEPMVILGPGLEFSSRGCGDWVAIDPETAFEGAVATSFGGDGSVFGGRDVVPGTYRASESTGEDSTCTVQAVQAYAEFAGAWERISLATSGGTTLIEVRAGDRVAANGCPDFELIDLAETLALAEGVESFAGDGRFIVGIDVRPGTYRQRAATGACDVTVYPEHLFSDSQGLGRVQRYSLGGDDDLTLTAGQSVELLGCGEFAP